MEPIYFNAYIIVELKLGQKSFSAKMQQVKQKVMTLFFTTT